MGKDKVKLGSCPSTYGCEAVKINYTRSSIYLINDAPSLHSAQDKKTTSVYAHENQTAIIMKHKHEC